MPCIAPIRTGVCCFEMDLALVDVDGLGWVVVPPHVMETLGEWAVLPLYQTVVLRMGIWGIGCDHMYLDPVIAGYYCRTGRVDRPLD